MWRRKTHYEPERQSSFSKFRERFQPFGAMMVGAVASAGVFVVEIIGGGWFRFSPISVAEAASHIPYFFVAASVVYFLGRLLGACDTPPAEICDKCQKIKGVDGNHDCACGGHFESLDRWEWVEDKEDERNRTET